MSAGFTTALRAKNKLVDIFTAALVDEPTNAYFNRPNAKTPNPEENVYVCDIVKGHREWKNLGRPPLTNQVEEDYQILVEVELRRRGSDGKATEERAWALSVLLEEALSRNASLDGLVHHALPGDFDMTSEGGQDGWACTYTFAVVIEARL
jgi:hypothetical protein